MIRNVNRIEIRTLQVTNAESWWNLRLEALEGEPLAFGKSPEEHRQTTIDAAMRRINDHSPNSFDMGAFDGETLVGMCTFIRSTNLKEQHKGNIYGVYVAPGYRNSGIGRSLLTATISRAKEAPTLEQILITVGANQESAKHLYLSLGFEIYGMEKRALKVGAVYIDEIQLLLPLR